MSANGPRLLAIVFVLLALGCSVDRGDDATARLFLSKVTNRDTSALELVEPNGEIAKAGWSGIDTSSRDLA